MMKNIIYIDMDLKIDMIYNLQQNNLSINIFHLVLFSLHCIHRYFFIHLTKNLNNIQSNDLKNLNNMIYNLRYHNHCIVLIHLFSYYHQYNHNNHLLFLWNFLNIYYNNLGFHLHMINNLTHYILHNSLNYS